MASSNGITRAVGTLAELVDLGPADVRAEVQPDGSVETNDGKAPLAAAASSMPPVAATTAPVGADPPADMTAKLEAFADGLKVNLPRDAGTELSLTRVDIEGMTLHLGYTVGRVMGGGETAAFDAYVMRTIKSLFCGRESREIRFLNENGVAFEMEYTDPRGNTVQS